MKRYEYTDISCLEGELAGRLATFASQGWRFREFISKQQVDDYNHTLIVRALLERELSEA